MFWRANIRPVPSAAAILRRNEAPVAASFAGAFAPKTRCGLLARNQVIKACAIPGLAWLAFGRDLNDALKLPEYRWPRLRRRATSGDS
jgi:hypothetical protein